MSRYWQVFKVLRPMIGGFLPRYWIQTHEIRFKNCLKSFQDSIFIENLSKKLNPNSLERHKVLKLTTQLPNPEITRATIDKLLRVLENVGRVELIKARCEEIKKFQPNLAVTI